jgi:cullin 1
LVIIKISSYLDSLLLYWFQVLPALNGKRDQDLLQEIVRRWSILKTMTLWLFRFFNYLDRYFIARRKLPSLQQTSYNTFYNLVSNGNS